MAQQHHIVGEVAGVQPLLSPCQLAAHDGANGGTMREEVVHDFDPAFHGAVADFHAVDARECESWYGVSFRPQHRQGLPQLELFHQLFLGVSRDVHFLFQQGDVFDGVFDVVFHRRVVHPAQEPLGVHKPNGRHVVGVVCIALNHEILRHETIDVLLVTRQELPFPVEPVVAGVALDVIVQHFWGIVLGIQREAHHRNVVFVPVPEVGPKQLLGDLRHMRCVGPKERGNPHLALERLGREQLPVLVGEFEGSHPLGCQCPAFHLTVLGEVGQGVEVVLRQEAKKNQPRQRQGQHHGDENESVFQLAHPRSAVVSGTWCRSRGVRSPR